MSPYLPLWYLISTVALLLWVKLLVTPPHEFNQPWHLIRPRTQFINRVIHDILCNGILPPPNLLLHRHQPRRIQGLHHQWKLPSLLPDLPIWHTCYPLVHLIVVTPHHLKNHLHHYPTIAPVKYHYMNHHLVNHCPCLHRRSRLCQYLFHHSPPLMRLPKISVQGHPVSVAEYDCAS